MASSILKEGSVVFYGELTNTDLVAFAKTTTTYGTALKQKIVVIPYQGANCTNTPDSSNGVLIGHWYGAFGVWLALTRSLKAYMTVFNFNSTETPTWKTLDN